MRVQGGGMGSQDPKLRTAGPGQQVRVIRICRDTYFVTTADGKTRPFWESNLRFKRDSSTLGPSAGTPVIVSTGMMGDRATVIFAKPDLISSFIKRKC